MAKQKFNDLSLRRLSYVVEQLPGLQESLDAQGVSLSGLKEIHIFGYGSLPNQPHYQPDSIEDAYLWGYRRDLCCKSVRSGNKQFPGLTLGLDQAKGAITPGAILSYDNLTPDKLIDMLKAFAKREVVKALPIYKFEYLEVEKEDGSKVPAIVCVADPESFGYVGDMLSDYLRQELSDKDQLETTIRRKGRQISEANGFLPKSKKHATAKSYFDRFIVFPLLAEVMSDDAVKIAKMTDEERFDMINEAVEGLDEMTDTIARNFSKRDLALHKENIYMVSLAHSVYLHRMELKANTPSVAKLLEQAEARQVEGWLEKKAKADKARTTTTPSGALNKKAARPKKDG